MSQKNKIVGGILLVSGTTIGAGILAMPVTTGLMGFLPSLTLFVFYWLLMTYSGLLFLEVNLWIKDDNVNIISMAKTTLGRSGEWVAWVLYLFLLYALTTAYMAASAPLFMNTFSALLGFHPPAWVGPLPFLLIFGFFVFKGALYVDYINRILMLGLVVTYILLTTLLYPEIEWRLLSHSHWKMISLSVAVVATAFGYHIIIPTLTRYLQRDVKGLVTVILVGCAIPLFAYLVWEFVTLGVVQLEGEHGLIRGYVDGRDVIDLITQIPGFHSIGILADLFLFFVIVTSFLGVSLSLRDFLADGLHIKKTIMGRLFLCFLTFIPPLIFSLSIQRAFFLALDYAGAFGVLLLLVILPACMVWRGRYVLQFSSEAFRAPGGKTVLATTVAISLLLIVVEVGNKMGIIHHSL